jgi:hypothetical protein
MPYRTKSVVVVGTLPFGLREQQSLLPPEPLPNLRMRALPLPMGAQPLTAVNFSFGGFHELLNSPRRLFEIFSAQCRCKCPTGLPCSQR